MRYPLIIIGAGASYGYVSKDEMETIPNFLPFPLIDRVCDAKYLKYLEDKIKRIEKKNVNSELEESLISTLGWGSIFYEGKSVILDATTSLSKTQNLEEKVSAIWDQAEKNNDLERKGQLIGLDFYLQFLFYFLSMDFSERTSNNYLELGNVISDFLGGDKESQVLIVNFNYDLLMNKRLERLDFQKEQRLKHIKIHGSCDECWIDNKDLIKPSSSESRYGCVDYFAKNNALGDFFKGSKRYKLAYIIKEIERGGDYIFKPSLILPFEKKDYQQDLDDIRDRIGKIDGILVIGWSARDKDFLELLMEQNKNKKGIPLFVVNGSSQNSPNKEDETNKIRNKFSKVAYSCFNGYIDFTQFMNGKYCEKFFRIEEKVTEIEGEQV